MMSEPGPRRSGLPYNPGLRDLIQAKRRWSSAPNIDDAKGGFRGWHERGYLPHRDEPGLTQFVTFNLQDCFPESLREEWAHLWEIEDDRQRRTRLEAYLDKGHGQCHLRRPDIAGIVEAALRQFHGQRYDLRAWVVMPNHGHALFQVRSVPMSQIVATWKKRTAREANRLLNRRGPFWAADFWDTYMRNAQHELKARRYIENNPVKAGLAREPKDWPWSSARFRDAYGQLQL